MANTGERLRDGSDSAVLSKAEGLVDRPGFDEAGFLWTDRSNHACLMRALDTLRSRTSMAVRNLQGAGCSGRVSMAEIVIPH